LAKVEFRLAVEKLREPDTASIDMALRLNPPTAELDLDAARAYALCSAAARDDRELKEFADRILEFVTDGVTRGLRRFDLDRIAELNPDLRQTAQWRAIDEMPPSRLPFTRSRLMLDPLPDLLTKLPPAGRR
jgi:hypothetical protein